MPSPSCFETACRSGGERRRRQRKTWQRPTALKNPERELNGLLSTELLTQPMVSGSVWWHDWNDPLTRIGPQRRPSSPSRHHFPDSAASASEAPRSPWSSRTRASRGPVSPEDSRKGLSGLWVSGPFSRLFRAPPPASPSPAPSGRDAGFVAHAFPPRTPGPLPATRPAGSVGS